MSNMSNVYTPVDPTLAAALLANGSNRAPKGFYKRQMTGFAKSDDMFAAFNSNGVLTGTKATAIKQSLSNAAKELKINVQITVISKDADGNDLNEDEHFVLVSKIDD